MPPTERLYYNDSHLTEFEARVTAVHSSAACVDAVWISGQRRRHAAHRTGLGRTPPDQNDLCISRVHGELRSRGSERAGLPHHDDDQPAEPAVVFEHAAAPTGSHRRRIGREGLDSERRDVGAARRERDMRDQRERRDPHPAHQVIAHLLLRGEFHLNPARPRRRRG